MSKYPHLTQLLAPYLHQDFDLEFDTAEDALNAAIADADGQAKRSCAVELEMLLGSGLDDAQLGALRLCDYYPPGDGFTFRSWLEHVLTRLNE